MRWLTTLERSPLAPDIPTMRESAPELSKFDVSSWFGVFLPKGCPPEIVDALNQQIKTMLDREEIRKNIAQTGAQADWATPAQFSAFVEAETTKFAAIIQKEGLQMDVN
jgi:tripartite-type tricarboxylate transporter receptor subunit TctC